MPKMILAWFTVLLLLLAPITFLPAQEQDDPHEGQPDSCNNFKGTEHKCECNQAMKCPTEGEDLREDKKCQVYCRKDKCRCVHPCTT